MSNKEDKTISEAELIRLSVENQAQKDAEAYQRTQQQRELYSITKEEPC